MSASRRKRRPMRSGELKAGDVRFHRRANFEQQEMSRHRLDQDEAMYTGHGYKDCDQA